LELDGYCPDINIAFEYNGIQHYQYVPYFHISPESFEEQKERDDRKKQICKKLGIFLCVIPSTYNYHEPDKLEKFIRDWVMTPIIYENGGVFL
jgi:hypothetical protein